MFLSSLKSFFFWLLVFFDSPVWFNHSFIFFVHTKKKYSFRKLRLTRQSFTQTQSTNFPITVSKKVWKMEYKNPKSCIVGWLINRREYGSCRFRHEVCLTNRTVGQSCNYKFGNGVYLMSHSSLESSLKHLTAKTPFLYQTFSLPHEFTLKVVLSVKINRWSSSV